MDKKMYETQQKLPLLREVNMMAALFNSGKGQKKLLHLITYSDEGSGNAEGDEWTGRVKHLEKIITVANKKVEETVQDKLDNIKKDLFTAISDEIDNKITKIENNITQKINR